jgi:hypothetical protein
MKSFYEELQGNEKFLMRASVAAVVLKGIGALSTFVSGVSAVIGTSNWKLVAGLATTTLFAHVLEKFITAQRSNNLKEMDKVRRQYE